MVNRREYIWNGVASIIASLLSAVLLLVATRINGTTLAGMLAITFSTATILNAIGDFGMRVFQVTDAKREYSFKDYLYARLVVDILMLVVAVIFIFITGYSFEKGLMCFLFVTYRFIESLSETYQGEMQLHKRLDLGAKSVVIRTCGAIIIFLLIDLFTENINMAIIAMIIWGIMTSFGYDNRVVGKFLKEQSKVEFSKVKRLVFICFPTFFSTLLNLYIINAPKYAIDSILTYQDQTIFNIIFLPTFTINLLSIFILKPLLLSLGVMWNEKKYHLFKNILVKMTLLILVLTVLVEIVCYFVGIDILTFIYGVNLVSYKWDLMILVISGGLSALSVLLFYALTTMRCQKLVAIPYILAAVVAIVVCKIMVESQGILGAAISSVIITSTLALTSIIILLWKLHGVKAKAH